MTTRRMLRLGVAMMPFLLSGALVTVLCSAEIAWRSDRTEKIAPPVSPNTKDIQYYWWYQVAV